MQRHKRHLGPYKSTRFLYANSVPFEVALRVIVWETDMITANRQAEILEGKRLVRSVFYRPGTKPVSTTQIHQELARIGIHIDRAK